MVSGSEIIFIFAVIFAGYWSFLSIARRTRVPWNFKSFFLGGGNLGGNLTENNTVGITFAWSGGTWFFAWTAFQFGPISLLSQIFWCFSIIWLAVLLPKILPNVRNHTIHGFLRKRYGPRSQKIAAVATTIGYVINAGYELFFSSLLFSRCLGRESLGLPVALILAVFVGSYCAIGGYKSNANIDKAQNQLGVLALAILVFLVNKALHVGGSMNTAVLIFTAGSAVYLVISVLTYSATFTRAVFTRIQDYFAVSLAVIALIVCLVILQSKAGGGAVLSTVVANSPIPISLIISTVGFQIFFNLIDMQNWQQIAANGDADPSTYRGLSWSIVRGSLYLMWFPALGGVLLGLALRVLSQAVNQDNIFAQAFQLVSPGWPDLGRGLLLGLLFLGFLATSLSTVGDLLMSALQTICFDIVWTKEVDRLLATPDSMPQQRVLVARAQRYLIPLSVFMVVSFYVLWKAYSTNILNFQAVMYAIPLSLLTPVFFALFWPDQSAGTGDWPAFLAISAAVLAIPIMFVLSLPGSTSPNTANWLLSVMPVVSNGLSLIVFFVARAFSRRQVNLGGRL